MPTTSPSLLIRLRKNDDREAWCRFVDLYSPLLKYWVGRFQLQPADASDLEQDILTALLTSIARFEQRPGMRFRGWLWTLTVNKFRERVRRAAIRSPQADSEQLNQASLPSMDEEIDAAEYRQYLVNRAMQLMQSEFEPNTWKACWEFVVRARSADEVANELGISVNSVYLAKSRVLRKLRSELADLLDE